MITPITCLIIAYAVWRLTKISTISQYQWFVDLLYKYPKLDYILSFKLLHCRACQAFWFTLFLTWLTIDYNTALSLSTLLFCVIIKDEIDAQS